jgi:hypothetical protein
MKVLKAVWYRKFKDLNTSNLKECIIEMYFYYADVQ